MTKRVLFYVLTASFFIFFALTINAEWNNWHYKGGAWNLESCIYEALMLICGFFALTTGREIRSGRNRYVAGWRF